MIRKVTATNLKGRSFSYELGRITIITGPNDAGKTSIRDACLLALTGYKPGYPKTAQGIFELSSGNRMDVAVELATDAGEYTVARAWELTGKKVKTTEQGVDQLPALPLVMLDSNEFFGKSDAGKVQMLFELLDLEGTTKSIREVVREIQKLEAVTMTDDLEEALHPAPEETLQAWLDRLLEFLGEQATTEGSNLKRYQKTQEGISQMALKDAPVDGQQVSRQVEETKERLAALQEAWGGIQEQVKIQEGAAARREEIQKQMAALRQRITGRELAPLEDLREDRNGIKELLEKLQAQHAKAEEKVKAIDEKEERRARLEERLAQTKTLQAQVTAAQALVKELEGKLADIGEPDVEGPMKKREALALELSRIKSTLEALEAQKTAEQKEYATQSAATECPCCGRAGDEWQAALEKKHQEKLNEISSQTQKLTKDLGLTHEQWERCSRLEDKARSIKKQREAIQTKLGEARVSLANAEGAGAVRDQIQSQLLDLGQTPERPDLVQMVREITTARERLVKVESYLEEWEDIDSLSRYQDELNGLGGEDTALTEKSAEINRDLQAVRERMKELEGLQQKAANQAADRKRLAEAQEQTEQVGKSLDTIKAIQKHLKATKETLVAEVFGPLLETAQVFTQKIIPTPLELRDGELGRYNGASWVPVRAFGGAYSAVTRTALQAALSVQSPSKVAITDEMDTMDEKTKKQFMANVTKAMKAGLLHQFIGLDVRASDYKSLKGATHIDLAEVAANGVNSTR